MTKIPSAAYTVDANGKGNEPSASQPVVTFVIPCYNVAVHLPSMFANLQAQEVDRALVELVFVIDGSPDESERLVREWMPHTDFAVTLVTQQNRGLSGARNTGIEVARGEFVSFPDPDDTLSTRYLADMIEAIRQHPGLSMFTSKLVRRDPDGTPRHHALNYRYTDISTTTVIDLMSEPEQIHLHGGMVFLRTAELRNHSLKFDERIRRGFEDAHLIARFLLALDAPQYALVPQAEYIYVAHPGAATALTDYSKYLNIIRYGYLQLLEDTGTDCPRWLGNLILYDISWLFKAYLPFISPVYKMGESDQTTLAELSREVLTGVGLANIRAFRIIHVPLEIRAAWETAVDPGQVSHIPLLGLYDPARQLQEVFFYSAQPEPEATASQAGAVRDVAFRKTREVKLFNQTWAYANIFWVAAEDPAQRTDAIALHSPQSTVKFSFEGRTQTEGEACVALEIAPLPFPAPAESMRVSRATQLRERLRNKRERLSLALAYRAGRLFGISKRFSDAWVCIDRNIQANDNAEALYRYLRKHRPDINAWFVIDRGSPDYRRLKAEGFRLVAHKTKKHFLLMKEAKVLASSMADHYVLEPFPRHYLPKTWTFTFLQHGVIHNSLHRWLNRRLIDVFLTSTREEYADIAGSPSPYRFSEREVALTGLPRHDRLVELQGSADNANPGVCRVLIMPTWRNYLLGNATDGKREVLDGFFETEFVRAWQAFFQGEFMAELLSRTDVEVVLLPHPGIDEHWKGLQLPAGMKRVSYVGDDVQKVIAGATFVVTDYSSQAFEGAFCGAPTAYFQFDRDEFYGGGHVASQGYFDHRRDGFGPVCSDLESLEENLAQMIAGTHPQLDEYRERIAKLYPFTDGKASERAVSAIEERLIPWTPEQR
ncbi:glycosyltransferase [Leucobacter viscericola]|uniref:Glycosyltransferase n=1 Tax=Leucobacter viscericola TaxID=2714935 RepID=A0A6G7XEJ6_9MICO|nr:CDP-glycerol glycerophosphotransferase family protein [Leucobacter viscericola]QIK63014.1 glycosyltransferase [Leucobacter viscericola]